PSSSNTDSAVTSTAVRTTSAWLACRVWRADRATTGDIVTDARTRLLRAARLYPVRDHGLTAIADVRRLTYTRGLYSTSPAEATCERTDSALSRCSSWSVLYVRHASAARPASPAVDFPAIWVGSAGCSPFRMTSIAAGPVALSQRCSPSSAINPQRRLTPHPITEGARWTRLRTNGSICVPAFDVC